TIENSTIAGNTTLNSFQGGGLEVTQGTMTVKSSIVAGNSVAGSPSNCSTGVTSLGNNLESGTDCGFTAPGDLQVAHPELGQLKDNGGPTAAMALALGSPAVDAGDAGCPPPATDQRGIARPQGPSCDIGAFELVPPPTIAQQSTQPVSDTAAPVAATIN